MPIEDSNSDQSTDYIAYIGLLLLALCFGSAFYFTDLALKGFSVLGTGAWRLIIAAMFIVPVCYALGHGLPKTLRSWIWVAGFAILAWITPFLLLVWAQSRIPTNIIGAFFAAVPLMILFLSWAILKVKISKRKIIGLCIGSLGLVLLAGPATLSQLETKIEYLPQLAALFASFCFAAGSIIIRMMPDVTPIQATGGASLSSAVLISPLAVWQIPTLNPEPSVIMGLLAVGVVSTGIGQFLRFILVRRRGPVFIVPNGYLTAMFAALFGMILLGETLTLETLLAFAVIMCGLWIASDGTGHMKQN